MKHTFKVLALAIILTLAIGAFGQNLKSREPNDGTKVSIQESYAATVNGGASSATVTSVIVPFHPRWSIEANVFLLPNQDSKIVTLGPRYARNLGNFLKQGKLFFDPNNIDLFAHVALGGKQQDLTGKFQASALSAYGEIGAVIHKGPIDITPVKIGLLRTSFGHSGKFALLSPNTAEIGASIGFHF